MKRLLVPPLKEVQYQREILISNSGNAGGYSYQNDSECGSGCQTVLVVFFLIVASPFIAISYWGIKRTRRLRKEQDQKSKRKKYIEKTTKNFEEFEEDVANKFKKICKEIIYENRFALQTERKKFLIKDTYGKIIDMGWESYENVKGDKSTAVDYFRENILNEELYNAFKKTDYPKTIFTSAGFEEEFYDILDWVKYCFAKKNLSKSGRYNTSISYWIIEEINKVCDEIQDKTSQFGDTSSMDGVEYEQYCKNILEDAGWEVEDTPITGDQGVDLIASIEDLRVCIQCKCFAKAVGNKAVQEVSTGMIHWNGTHAVVVAKSGFTKSAKTLAASTKVILTSDSELENLENLVL